MTATTTLPIRRIAALLGGVVSLAVLTSLGQARAEAAPPSSPTDAAAVVATAAATVTSPSHLDWALDLALNVTPDRNEYGSRPTVVTWPGVDGATEYQNRSDCSMLLTRVLEQAYGWTSTDIASWTGDATPTAAQYHDTIVAQRGVGRVTKVADIAPGDLLAAKYLDAAATVTGHTMIAAGSATARKATSPKVAGTTQYELRVIDSSRTGHGSTDTRRRADGTWEDGIGVGVLRLYADSTGTVVGYAWSTSSGSTYYDATTRPLAIGRLP